MRKIKNNIPNAITISRIISCILGAISFTTGNVIPAVCFYVYGAVSDAFDGFLARKLDAVSEFGKKLDPISDKLYALSLMAPAIILKNYLMILPFVFEGIISGINIYSEIKYKKAHTEKVGKLKTIMLFPTMILGLIATLEPYLYIAFIPSLYVSLKYQARTIEVYMNQLDNFKNANNVDGINISTCSCDECNNNLNNCCNNIKINNKVKEKKLIRKKEYNDRY